MKRWLKRWWKWLAIAAGIVAGIVAGVVLWRMVGPELGIAAIATSLTGWFFGRRKAKTSDMAKAWERARQATLEAEARVDDAGDRAAARVAAHDRFADEEVENADDLVDVLCDSDPGPKPDDS